MYQPSPTVAFGRMGRKVAKPIDDAVPWGPPPLPDLIAAIDRALQERSRR